jgi:6-phosphogluconolactonase (cycloisomerase 2 family)
MPPTKCFLPSAVFVGAFLLFMMGCGGSSRSSTGTNSGGTSTSTPSGSGNSGSTGSGSGGTGTSTGSGGGTTSTGGGTGTGSGGTSGGSTGGAGGSTTAEFLYAVENPNAASTVEAFSISSTGALTAVAAPISAGDNATDIAGDPSGKYLVTGNSSGCCATPSRPPQLISYTIAASGSLTQANQTDLPNSNDTLNSLLLDPTGTDLYASSQAVMIEGTISSFSVDRSSGSITLLEPDPANTIMPGRMAIHPNGKFLYAAILVRHHYPEQGGFDLFLRDPATGKLTDTTREFHSTAPASDFYGDSAFALNAQYLLGVALDSNKITVWTVNADTGDLAVASELSGSFKGLAVDNSGKYAIVTLADGTVNSYRVNADGTLTQGGTAVATPGVTNVVTDSSGKFVYSENSTASQIYGFAFDSNTGALSTLPGSPFTTSGVPIRMATTMTK